MLLSMVGYVLAVLFGAAASIGCFRFWSIGIPASYTLITLLRVGTVASSHSQKAIFLIKAQERTIAYSFLLWVMVLAIRLLQSIRDAVPPSNEPGR